MITREGKQAQIPLDATLDGSSWSPEALEGLLDLAVRLPFEEACTVATRFGLATSNSELERLTRTYGEACRKQVHDVLRNPEASPSPAPPMNALASPRSATRSGRIMVLQADGVFTLGRPEGGTCPGLEIKSAVLYPQDAPGDRWMLADVMPASDFQAHVHGLLERAAVTPADTLIGLSDGANWLENLFDTLGATRITDVYHATTYLDTVMQALEWSEERRLQERRAWYRGQVNARDWLKQHQPPPGLTVTWSQEALTALRYLVTRVTSMDYAIYTRLGYPIGSGQIEGMNKSVIGTRMKRSGMHWSRGGAARMAALRAQHCARHPLITFHHLRRHAYPTALLSP